jgi:predicted TIM-barrel fold metal-dependent hydrolase
MTAVTDVVSSEAVEPSRRATILIDADVHPITEGSILERLNEPYRTRFQRYGVRNPGQGTYPRTRNTGSRLDSRPDGTPGGGQRLTQEQLLDEYDEDFAILLHLPGRSYSGTDPEYSQALCAATNEMIAEEWLDVDSRYRGTITVPFEDADLAVKEIERWAGDRRFCQILVSGSAESPMGDKKYWPIYKAAAEANLPLGAHLGGYDYNRAGTGWPSFFLEEHVGLHYEMPSMALSMIASGVFESIPTLQCVAIETCFSWSVSLQWAMDQAYSRMRDEMTSLSKKPSEYFRENFWFTTQPFEEPDDPNELVQAIAMMGMEDHIMFASDYPHFDFDSPTRALPPEITGELRQKIMGDNACRLYNLSTVRR